MSAQSSQFGPGPGKKAVHVKVSTIKTKVWTDIWPWWWRPWTWGDAFGHHHFRQDRWELSWLRTQFSRVLRTSDFVPCLFLTEPNLPVCHMFLEVTFVAVRFDQYFPPSFALSWAELVSQYSNLYTVSYFSREGHSWFFTSIGRRTLSYRESLPSCRFPLRSRDLNLRT